MNFLICAWADDINQDGLVGAQSLHGPVERHGVDVGLVVEWVANGQTKVATQFLVKGFFEILKLRKTFCMQILYADSKTQ